MAGVRVLYIGGLGRSGSTVLSRALGELPGYFHVGELVFVWTRGVAENHLCGCGSPFRDCPFWTKVGERAFGGWEAADPVAMAALQHSVDRTRYVPQLLRPQLSPSYRRRLLNLTTQLEKLYDAIQEISGCTVIVDSSKHVSYAAVLRQVTDLDLRLLHVVRDSRGVAYSWAKKVKRPEIIDEDAYMAAISTPKLAARWSSYNGVFDVVRMAHGTQLLLRYEDFVADPKATLARIAELAGTTLGPDDLGFVQESGLRLSFEHSVSGNPMRFSDGAVPLRVDDAWRAAMSAKDRRIVTAMTMPGLLRYGYRLSGK